MHAAAWYHGTPDQRSPKHEMTGYAPMPVILLNFMALGQTAYEKSVRPIQKNFQPSLFWPFGPKFTDVRSTV